MSDAISDIVTATAPLLVGVWAHDPEDAGGTIANYLHTGERAETLAPDVTSFNVAGRERAIVEFGEHTGGGIDTSVVVPFGGDHDGLVEWWRRAARNRRPICYRDNRSRVLYGVMLEGVSVTDERLGSTVSVKLTEVDYEPEV